MEQAGKAEGRWGQLYEVTLKNVSAISCTLHFILWVGLGKEGWVGLSHASLSQVGHYVKETDISVPGFVP